MKQIAIINTSYNLSLSTCKLSVGLQNYLNGKGYKAYYCYGRGSEQEADDLYRIEKPWQVKIHALLCRLTGYQGVFSLLPTIRLVNFLKKKHIDTVYAGTLHGYYINEPILLSFIAKNNITLVYMLFDEYPFLGRCCYSKDCERYLEGCGNCPYIKDYPKSMFFDSSKRIFKWKEKYYTLIKKIAFAAPAFVYNNSLKSPLTKLVKPYSVDFGIDLNKYKPKDTTGLMKKLGIPSNKTILVCIAPSAYPEKGSVYFRQLAERLINDEKYVFVHVGYTDNDKECLPKNYIPIGYVYDQEELTQYYSLGDLFVFPSLVDAMPNTCIEALACGSPLLLFNTSGMPYLADGTVAYYVEPRNVDQMESVVVNIAKKDKGRIDECRRYASKRYNKDDYFERLREIGESLEE